MRRRPLLSVLGVWLLPAAGCLGPEEPTADRDSPTTNTPAYDPEGAFHTVRIGDPTGEIIPHQVGIWNAAVDLRAIHVTVVDNSVGVTRHDRTHEVPGDTALALELQSPARYRLTFRVPDPGLEQSVDVPRSLFDTCNNSYTHVSVRKTDRITVRTLSTELACLTETP